MRSGADGPEANRRLQQVPARATRFGLFGEKAECVDETNHHPAGGIGADFLMRWGDAIANFAQIAFNAATRVVPDHCGGSSAIRQAMTSSPSADSPASSDAIRSAIAALNTETCVRRRFVSATSLSTYWPTETPSAFAVSFSWA